MTIYDAEEAARYRAATMNMELSSAKMSARTPLEAGPLNVRSQVQLIVEIEAGP